MTIGTNPTYITKSLAILESNSTNNWIQTSPSPGDLNVYPFTWGLDFLEIDIDMFDRAPRVKPVITQMVGGLGFSFALGRWSPRLVFHGYINSNYYGVTEEFSEVYIAEKFPQIHNDETQRGSDEYQLYLVCKTRDGTGWRPFWDPYTGQLRYYCPVVMGEDAIRVVQSGPETIEIIGTLDVVWTPANATAAWTA